MKLEGREYPADMYLKLKEALNTFDASDEALLQPFYKFKSHQYQYKYKERNGYDDNFFDVIENPNNDYDDKYYELVENLYNEVIRILNENFNLKQKMFIKMRFIDDMTTKAIAKVFNTAQPTIQFAIHGDKYKNEEYHLLKKQYKNVKIKRHRVGLINRLKEYCMADEKICIILEDINHIDI